MHLEGTSFSLTQRRKISRGGTELMFFRKVGDRPTCAQGSLLVGSWGPIRCQELKTQSAVYKADTIPAVLTFQPYFENLIFIPPLGLENFDSCLFRLFRKLLMNLIIKSFWFEVIVAILGVFLTAFLLLPLLLRH